MGIDSISDLELEIEDAKNFGDVFICLLDLLLNRIMRSRLNENGGLQSPLESVRILNLLKRIKINVKGEKISALTKFQEEQLELFDLLEVDWPK